jgi:hypothetical protein
VTDTGTAFAAVLLIDLARDDDLVRDDTGTAFDEVLLVDLVRAMITFTCRVELWITDTH